VFAASLLLFCIVLAPGIHIIENAFMVAEAGAGNWVPPASSMTTFKCTHTSEGGNATYCLYGHDWTYYYASCDPARGQCSGGFLTYPKSAAERCAGFSPHNERSWCDNRNQQAN
jgi:hypothetical protein